MTPPAPRHHDLAATLISHAAGLTCDTAAAELIARHHSWLARADFLTGHIHAGTRHDGHPGAPRLRLRLSSAADRLSAL